MNNVFGSIPVPKKGSTNFDESHELAGTFPLSLLCPVFMTDTIPGDRWKINTYNLTKLETLISPAMQQINASLLWFKLPKRLVFRHFNDWYTGGEKGDANYQKPHTNLFYLREHLLNIFGGDDVTALKVTRMLFGPGSLWNYLGLPIPLVWAGSHWEVIPYTSWRFNEDFPNDESLFIDMMPIMAYHLIVDQYFRDQTLDNGCFLRPEEGILIVNNDYNKTIFDEDGNSYTLPNCAGADLSYGGNIPFPELIRLLILDRRAWKKEYFTSALPTPQRGPQVTLDTFNGQHAPVVVKTGHSYDYDGHLEMGVDFDGNTSAEYDPDNTLFVNASNPKPVELAADLSGLSPITIVAFRNLFRLQAFLEKNNVAGGRLIETILAHWGVRVPDFTVQRAVHVRSTSIPVQISEVTATANSDGYNSVIGDQAGRAKGRGNLGNVSIYTHEPSFIFGIYCVTAPPSYVGQGIPRMFQHITRFDEPWRDFQNIGEQAIKNRELYLDWGNHNPQSSHEYNNGDFGYQQRYSEYKYMPNRVVGDFCTDMSFWHMARMFKGRPMLNADFVKQTLDERIFAVQNKRPVVADFFFQAVAKRKLSKFSTPKLT